MEAQTVSNTYLAIENNLQVIPVINKVDLPSAQIDDVTRQIIELIGCDKDEIILASAKNGIGIDEIFDAINPLLPTPQSITLDWHLLIASIASSFFWNGVIMQYLFSNNLLKPKSERS